MARKKRSHKDSCPKITKKRKRIRTRTRATARCVDCGETFDPTDILSALRHFHPSEKPVKPLEAKGGKG